jgi:hypothetical protein
MIRSSKVVMPVALAVAVAVLAGSVVLIVRFPRSKRTPSRNQNHYAFSESPESYRTPVPELHVLSTNMIDENVMYADGGRKQNADVKILSPLDSQYTQAVAKPGKQGVLQLRVKFEADGSISDITPLAKRSLCGICLLPDIEAKAISPDLPKTRKRDGVEVVGLDPTLSQSRDLVDAAVAAVKRINFIPFQSEGKAVPTHGLVECVFRLD